MKKKILIPIALIAFALTLGITANLNSIIPAFASSEHEQYREHKQHYNCLQTLVVTGTGTATVQSDFATISFHIETASKNLEDAQSENAAAMQNLKHTLGEHNISEQDLTTNWFNIYPEHDYHYGQRIIGHRVSNQLSVKVKQLDNVGKVIDLLTANGANMISGVQFGIEDNSKAYNEALTKAVESAKQKAAVLANTADFDNLKIVAIKETPNGNIGFERYDHAMYSGASNTSIMQNGIEVSATVKIVFKNIA